MMNPEYYYRNCTWKNVPDTCMVELTNACNFSCIMCSNKFMARKKGFMNFETFKKTLDACKDAEIRNIKLYTTGESLLHPDFMKFWRLAMAYPFDYIMISTNGLLLSEEIIKEILESPKVRIQFSFSGWDKRSYEKRYVGGDFEKAIEKIRLIMGLIEEKKLPKNTLTINGVVSGTTGAIEKTKDFLKSEFNMDESQLKIHNSNNWIDVVSNKNGNKKNEKSEGKRHYCHIANTRIGVLYDGKVTACGCLDVNGELVVGEINKEGIKEIRNGKLFNELVDKLNDGDISSLMCSNCDSLKIIE